MNQVINKVLKKPHWASIYTLLLCFLLFSPSSTFAVHSSLPEANRVNRILHFLKIDSILDILFQKEFGVSLILTTLGMVGKNYLEILFKKVVKNPIWALVYTLILCVLLFSPSSNFGDTPEIPGSDKVAHILIFLGLGFLWESLLEKKFVMWVFLITFGLFTEIVQYALPDWFMRSFDWWDLVADGFGLALGILLAHQFKKWFS